MAQHSNGNDNGFEKIDSDELLVSSSGAGKGKSGGLKPTVTGGKQTESYPLDPRVVNLIYWRDIRKTAIVFTSMVFLLLSIAFYSIISVAAYLSLAILAVTLSFLTKSRVLAFVRKTPVVHPFRQHLDKDVNISRERVHQFIDSLTGHAVIIAKEARRLYLVEDVPSSLKLALFFWAMTYVGDWFNGMSLVVLGFVGVFTLPKFYEAYRVQIDNCIDIVQIQVKQVIHKVQTKLPAKKKAE